MKKINDIASNRFDGSRSGDDVGSCIGEGSGSGDGFASDRWRSYLHAR